VMFVSRLEFFTGQLWSHLGRRCACCASLVALSACNSTLRQECEEGSVYLLLKPGLFCGLP
jgi:hypothetical protein